MLFLLYYSFEILRNVSLCLGASFCNSDDTDAAVKQRRYINIYNALKQFITFTDMFS